MCTRSSWTSTSSGSSEHGKLGVFCLKVHISKVAEDVQGEVERQPQHSPCVDMRMDGFVTLTTPRRPVDVQGVIPRQLQHSPFVDQEVSSGLRGSQGFYVATPQDSQHTSPCKSPEEQQRILRSNHIRSRETVIVRGRPSLSQWWDILTNLDLAWPQ